VVAETIPNPATTPEEVEAAEVTATTDVDPTTTIDEEEAATEMTDVVVMAAMAAAVAAAAGVNLAATRAGAMEIPETTVAVDTAAEEEEAVTTDVVLLTPERTSVDFTGTCSLILAWNARFTKVTTKPPGSTLTTTTKSPSKFPERTLPIRSKPTPLRPLARISTATPSSVGTPDQPRFKSILVPLVALVAI